MQPQKIGRGVISAGQFREKSEPSAGTDSMTQTAHVSVWLGIGVDFLCPLDLWSGLREDG